MPLLIDTYWARYKEVAPIRNLRALYRFLHRQLSRGLTGKQLLHRLAAGRSYLGNSRLLRRRLKQALAGGRRPVIAISQVLHLGDIVACEPVLRRTRLEHPEAFIVFALQRDYRELADSHPEVDHVLPLACVTEWVCFSRSPLFDLVIDLNLEGRTCNACLVPLRKPDRGNGVTFENYYNFGSLIATFSKSAGIAPPEDGPRLYIGDADLRLVDALRLPKQYVCLHAGSNEAVRNLPAGRWRELVHYINASWGLPVVEVGLETIALSPAVPGNRSLCGKLSILQSAEVIRRGMLYLGGDSGPAHLANAVGAYGVVLLGSYRGFRRYQPFSGNYAYGRECELIHHDGPVAEIPLDVVREAIARRICALGGFADKQEGALPDA